MICFPNCEVPMWREAVSRQQDSRDSFTATSPPRISKLALALCVNCGFQYKIPCEETVHSMAKTVQKPQTFLIRDNLQSLCAWVKLYRQLYLVYQISVDTVGQLLEESIYYELEMRSSTGFFILLFYHKISV